MADSPSFEIGTLHHRLVRRLALLRKYPNLWTPESATPVHICLNKNSQQRNISLTPVNGENQMPRNRFNPVIPPQTPIFQGAIRPPPLRPTDQYNNHIRRPWVQGRRPAGLWYLWAGMRTGCFGQASWHWVYVCKTIHVQSKKKKSRVLSSTHSDS